MNFETLGWNNLGLVCRGCALSCRFAQCLLLLMPFGQGNKRGMKFIKERQRLTPVKIGRNSIFFCLQSFDLAFDFNERFSQCLFSLQGGFFLKFLEISFDLTHGFGRRIASCKGQTRNAKHDASQQPQGGKNRRCCHRGNLPTTLPARCRTCNSTKHFPVMGCFARPRRKPSEQALNSQGNCRSARLLV